VIESIKRTMVLFDPDGTPTRIKMALTVKGFEVPANAVAEAANASPDRTHTVAVAFGDTLPTIAFRIYGDASLWREIAAQNEIEDPSRLSPGTILEVPRVERRRR
jgi:nucleoid-associated protein YgaU